MPDSTRESPRASPAYPARWHPLEADLTNFQKPSSRQVCPPMRDAFVKTIFDCFPDPRSSYADNPAAQGFFDLAPRFHHGFAKESKAAHLHMTVL